MVAAMKYGRVSARINGLAVVWRFGLRPRMAEQRESKLVGEVGVCAKALQQRTRLVSTV